MLEVETARRSGYLPLIIARYFIIIIIIIIIVSHG